MSNIVIYDAKSEDFQEKAKSLLPEKCVQKLTEYIEAGKYQISPETVASFFQLYLNGSTPEEIASLNKGFNLEAIHWAMVKYDWPTQRDKYLMDLQDNIRLKMVKTQLEATSLLTDMISASNKRNSEKLKKYIQTGNDKDLDGAMNIETLGGLLKAIEGLQKITGADKTTKVKSEHTETLNVNVNSQQGNSSLSPEDAAKILEIAANAKRNKN